MSWLNDNFLFDVTVLVATQSNDFERVDNGARQSHVIENNIDEQITRVVSSAVMTVENGMHDAILTALDNVVIPSVEMAAQSTTGSTGHGKYSEVQNPDQRDFLGNNRNTPLMSASSRLYLDNKLNRNDETHNIEDFEDGDFPALKPNYDRRAHAHHKCSLQLYVKNLRRWLDNFSSIIKYGRSILKTACIFFSYVKSGVKLWFIIHVICDRTTAVLPASLLVMQV